MGEPKDILKSAREKKGLSQTELADLLAKELKQTYSMRQYQRLEEGIFPKYKKEVIAALDKILGTKLSKTIYDINSHTENPSNVVNEPFNSYGEKKSDSDPDLRTLIDSNNKLATAMMGCQEDQRELIQMLKEERKRNRTTERDPEKIDIALEKRLSDILMAVVEVGVGTKWKTRKEGIEEVNRFLDGTAAGQTKAGSRAGAHK